MRLPFFRNKSWSIAHLDPPWGQRKSIYWHIANHTSEDTLGLSEGGETLPDEGLIRGDNQWSWAAGAIDSLLGSPLEGSDADKELDELYSAVIGLTKESSNRNLERLYTILTSANTIGIVDRFLERLIEAPPQDHDRLHSIARWLAMESADREVVKFAISIIGLFRDEADLDLLMTLGRHEEFTLYVSVAIQNSEKDVENRLWKLAQHVRGWGRIQIVERLSSTDDPYIKEWLLREGWSNEIMTEYTALMCARAGDLTEKLKRSDVDDELLHAAGEILTAIMSGSGPAEGYESYPEGAETCEAYLRLLERRDNSLDALVFVDRLEQFLRGVEKFAHLSDEVKEPWETRRESLLDSVRNVKQQPGWREKVMEHIDSEDRQTFWLASESAKLVGIDPWPYYFDRIKRGEDYWWHALQTDDPARIDQVVEHAESTIPLDKIATGPGNDLGLGPEFEEHRKLDWVLQELRRFPGKGLRLIRAGLRSPVVRNRNMAVHAIAAIPVAERDLEIAGWLSGAYEIEPNEQAKEFMRTVIAGEIQTDQA